MSIYSSVTILLFPNFAHVQASPTTCAISVNLVDNFPFSPANLDAYSTILAIADLSNCNNPSCSQNVWTNRANLFTFSSFIGAVSSNSTFILNSFLKSISIDNNVWYILAFPISITFKSSGIGSGFNDTIITDERCSIALFILNSFTLNTLFNSS